MSIKRVGIVLGVIVASLGLLIAVFVGGILGIIYYSIGNSDAAATAKQFLRSNEQLKKDIGDVKGFGRFVSGNIRVENGSGTAILSLNVIGEKSTVPATVELIYANGRPWRVTAASYKNGAGQRIDLLNPYESLRLNLWPSALSQLER